MCAAPGSKTSQIVEWVDGEAAVNRDMFSGSQSSVDANGCADSADKPRRLPRGLVIANDADNKRCYTLIHRIKSLQSPSVLVTNHDASQFPTLYTRDQHGAKRQLYFDRILCDVPCSGDGTMRKNPLIWRTWNPNNAIGLHSYVRPLNIVTYNVCAF
jgi:16S rRNA C967 or C1407 C5-methylase (RsmB/RsmF family)